MLFLLYILLFLAFILSILTFLWAFAFISIIVGRFRTGVPFVPIKKEMLNEIQKVLNVQKNSVFYDLGCGDGRVCRKIAQTVPESSVIGIELTLVPYVMTQIKNKLHPLKNIKVMRANFFEVNLSDATHIFVYLFPKIVDRLLPKFEKELKHGTHVVSCDFPFSKKEPHKIMTVKIKDKQHMLYVYEF